MKHDPDLIEIHNRFLVQAGWTAAIRAQWLERLAPRASQRMLEVGAGTGAIISEIADEFNCSTFGLDIDPHAAHFAQANDADTRYTIGDGKELPYPAATFDFAICHFLLLWLESPNQVLAEMKRVTRPGGWVLALAEPDYGGRIDYPDSLADLGVLQEQALQQQGCDTRIGRKLRCLFHEQNLMDIRVGVLGGEWQTSTTAETLESEWQTLVHDLESILPSNELEKLQRIDRRSWQEGQRLLFVPTFYAGGQVPIT
jgi:SAM-dependent methyltransferase